MLTNLYNFAALIVPALRKAWPLGWGFRNVPTSVGLQVHVGIKKQNLLSVEFNSWVLPYSVPVI